MTASRVHPNSFGWGEGGASGDWHYWTRRYGWVAWTNGSAGGVPGGCHRGYRGSSDLGLQVLDIRNRPDRTRAPYTVTASAVANQ